MPIAGRATYWDGDLPSCPSVAFLSCARSSLQVGRDAPLVASTFWTTAPSSTRVRSLVLPEDVQEMQVSHQYHGGAQSPAWPHPARCWSDGPRLARASPRRQRIQPSLPGCMPAWGAWRAAPCTLAPLSPGQSFVLSCQGWRREGERGRYHLQCVQLSQAPGCPREAKEHLGSWVRLARRSAPAPRREKSRVRVPGRSPPQGQLVLCAQRRSKPGIAARRKGR